MVAQAISKIGWSARPPIRFPRILGFLSVLLRPPLSPTGDKLLKSFGFRVRADLMGMPRVLSSRGLVRALT